MKRIPHYASTGLIATVDSSFSRALLAQMATRGFEDRNHMRVGRFGVAKFVHRESGDVELVAGEIFPPDATMGVARTSEFWEESRRDRLTQLREIETLLIQLPTHPLHAAILADCTAERVHLDAVNESSPFGQHPRK